MFPNCLEVDDMDILAKRENDLTTIKSYTGYSFFFSYLLGSTAYYGIRLGTLPVFKNVMKHSVLGVAGTFCAGMMAEKLAAESYYNVVLMNLVEKYNFTPEEVMDLQRNLNQYYIQKDREEDVKRQ